ncbi:U8-agatoxin-Ao1a-like isoform X2 [Hermetia illucens]|uniref:U8-agatoxin-Ao1a-like isoform X2 n=1 Tax=Hermetia illucens TaxID=343691 RepID=UPI0018CC2823|nr:U8-agatoxin-Ao1a-like isoform X2 [Hermetia illucens]
MCGLGVNLNLLFGFILIALIIGLAKSEMYSDQPANNNAYIGNYLDDLDFNAVPADKRACIRRGGNCDHRPNDCCYNSSCRCNLWGSNCRCQRMGLFQKWG